jgi:hypothetical protein
MNLLQFCLVSLAGRIEENQQHLIEYLVGSKKSKPLLASRMEWIIDSSS